MSHPKQTNIQSKASEIALSRVRLFIKEQGFGPGDALPPERELAQRFDVSRHTLREALRIMEERGVLTSRRGSGTYIAPNSPVTLGAALVDCLRSELAHLRDIFQFREIVEPQVAALAAQHVQEDHLADLQALLREQSNTSDPAAQNRLDTSFHRLIATASGNMLLAQMVTEINQGLSQLRLEHLIDSERQQASLKGHIQIVDALQARDAKAAEHAMRTHISIIANLMFDRYQQSEALPD